MSKPDTSSPRIVEVNPNGQDVEHVLINPSEAPGEYGREELWSMQFGAYGCTFLLVWARGPEDALEEAASWLADHAPGHIMEAYGPEHSELVKEACDEAGLPYPMPDDWCSDSRYDEAVQSAEADLTYTESGYLTSYEWWGGEASDELVKAALEHAPCEECQDAVRTTTFPSRLCLSDESQAVCQECHDTLMGECIDALHTFMLEINELEATK